MKNDYRLRTIAAAVTLVLAASSAPSRADEPAADVDPLAAYTDPDSRATFGFASVAEASRHFAQYTGFGNSRSYVTAGIDLLTRDDDSGTWFAVTGRNLGLETRELRIEQDRQGHWGYYVDYNRIVRQDPLTVSTALGGFGSSSVAINGTARTDRELGMNRDRITVGFDRTLPANFDVEVRWRHESKDGARLFGRGSGVFLAEPIDSRTQQLDAIVRYTGPKLQLAGGYYGSVYSNRPAFLDVSTGTDISLPPDNEAHQVYLSGGYSLARSTRVTFKMAYATASQDERFFIAPDFAGNTRTSLDGRIDTVSAQLGISTRPLPGLSLLANLRYEDRDDRTPHYQFLAASTGRDGFNTPFSRRTTAGKLEASYQLPLDIRLTGGVDLDSRKRSTLTIRQASWRVKNDETSYRLELRRSMSDTLNGAIAVVRAKRDGSDYLPANNAAAADLIDPVHFADRDRDTVRMSVDWTPLETLSLQAMFDDSKDTYDGRALGPQTGKARFYSLDGAYTLADNWQLNLWASREETRIDQATVSGANGALVAAQTWQARLRNVGDGIGAGINGRLNEKLEVGAEMQYEKDRNEYQLIATLPVAALLPDIDTRHSRLRLFLQYALRERMGVRIDYVDDRFDTNDWTWTGWVYADGSTITLPNDETGRFIGLSAYFNPR